MANLSVLKNDKGMVEKAISKMTKALTLCAGQQKKYYEKNLYLHIYKAKKLQWYMREKEDEDKKVEIIQYLQSQMEKDSSLDENQR